MRFRRNVRTSADPEVASPFRAAERAVEAFGQRPGGGGVQHGQRRADSDVHSSRLGVGLTAAGEPGAAAWRMRRQDSRKDPIRATSTTPSVPVRLGWATRDGSEGRGVETGRFRCDDGRGEERMRKLRNGERKKAATRAAARSRRVIGSCVRRSGNRGRLDETSAEVVEPDTLQPGPRPDCPPDMV